MKTKRFYRMLAGAALSLFALTTPAQGQISPDTYFNVDWQINLPLGNKFAGNGSGWGANFEGGYYLTPGFALGGFINYHTNHEYVPRKTLTLSDASALTTDQQHSLFQLPFGVTTHYRFDVRAFQPYVGIKVGAEYAKLTSDFNIYEMSDHNWGLYLSPEVGFEYYPWPYGIGFHAAIYYSYSTNQGKLLDTKVHSLNNLGFRVGLAF